MVTTLAAQSTMIQWVTTPAAQNGYNSCCTEHYDTTVPTPAAQISMLPWLQPCCTDHYDTMVNASA